MQDGSNKGLSMSFGGGVAVALLGDDNARQDFLTVDDAREPFPPHGCGLSTTRTSVAKATKTFDLEHRSDHVDLCWNDSDVKNINKGEFTAHNNCSEMSGLEKTVGESCGCCDFCLSQFFSGNHGEEHKKKQHMPKANQSNEDDNLSRQLDSSPATKRHSDQHSRFAESLQGQDRVQTGCILFPAKNKSKLVVTENRTNHWWEFEHETATTTSKKMLIATLMV